MFDKEFAFSRMLASFESTLMIDYTGDDKIATVIDRSVKALENKHGFTLDKDIFTLRDENQLGNTTDIEAFMRDIKQCLAEMSLYNQLKLFHKNVAFNLSDVNYLGFGKAQLMTSLRYLQDEAEQMNKGKDIIEPIINALNTIPQCQPKRLFVFLLMFERLGIREGVAIVAQLLYMGGLV